MAFASCCLLRVAEATFILHALVSIALSASRCPVRAIPELLHIAFMGHDVHDDRCCHFAPTMQFEEVCAVSVSGEVGLGCNRPLVVVASLGSTLWYWRITLVNGAVASMRKVRAAIVSTTLLGDVHA